MYKSINFGHEFLKRCAIYVHQLRKVLDPITDMGDFEKHGNWNKFSKTDNNFHHAYGEQAT